MKLSLVTLVALASVCLASRPDVGAQEPQYVSPSGASYYAQKDEKDLVGQARQKLDADPTNVDLMIALGDAHATVWDHKAAIGVYDRALTLAPDKPLLLQQRGHRRLSIRRFDAARVDLEAAVELDAKLASAWYYLGLLRYLSGDFQGAAEAYQKNIALADKFESALAGADWLYMSLRRGKRDADAAKLLERVDPAFKIEGNTRLYFDRLLLYKGLRREADLFASTLSDIETTTLAYGVGNWHLVNGRDKEARTYFEKAVATSAWPALAFIAAESDLRAVKR